MGKSSLASVDNVFKNTTALVPKPSTELSTKSPNVVKTIDKWLTPGKMGPSACISFGEISVFIKNYTH